MPAVKASVLLRLILDEGKLKHARFKRARQSIATEMHGANRLLCSMGGREVGGLPGGALPGRRGVWEPL